MIIKSKVKTVCEMQSRYLYGEELINSLKAGEFSKGYFSVGYAPFVAIDGREVGIPDRGAKDMCRWVKLDATVKLDMSIDRAKQPIDVALVQPSLSKSFLTKNGILKIRASTSANDASILQPNAEYFGCGFVSRANNTASNDSLAVWDIAYNFDAAFLCSVNSETCLDSHFDGDDGPDVKSKKFTKRQKTSKSTKATDPWKLMPSFFYPSIDDFADCSPYNCPWIACCPGKGGTPLANFKHPSRGLYLFGDLPPALITRCAFHVTPKCGNACGVDQLASVVLYDRFVRRQENEEAAIEHEKNLLKTVGAKKSNSHRKRKLRTKGIDYGNFKISVNKGADANKNEPSNKGFLEACQQHANDKGKDFDYLNNGEMKAVIYSEKQFRSRIFFYLKQHYGFSGISRIGDDTLLINTDDSPEASSKLYLKLLADPVLARVMQSIFFVTNASCQFTTLCNLLVQLVNINPSIVLRVQTKPNSLGKKVIDELPSTVNLHPKEFTHVLNVVQNAADGMYLYSVVPHSFHFTSGSGYLQMVKLYRQPHISRSYFKLWEIHNRGLITLCKDESNVLNIGNTPGWTEYLSLQCKQVTSISNNRLHMKLASCTNVQHIKMRCEEGLDSYNELKADQAGDKFDIIFANLNCGPRQAINTILLYSSLLKENDGLYVLLLKLPSAIKPQVARQYFMELLLRKGVGTIEDVFLFNNGPKEITFVMRP